MIWYVCFEYTLLNLRHYFEQLRGIIGIFLSFSNWIFISCFLSFFLFSIFFFSRKIKKLIKTQHIQHLISLAECFSEWILLGRIQKKNLGSFFVFFFLSFLSFSFFWIIKIFLHSRNIFFFKIFSVVYIYHGGRFFFF